MCIISVLTSEERQQLFPSVLPSFVRFCKAFPPLMEDVVGLLLQYGRICASEASRRPLNDNGLSSPRHLMTSTDLVCNGYELDIEAKAMLTVPREVSETFASILRQTVLERRLY